MATNYNISRRVAATPDQSRLVRGAGAASMKALYPLGLSDPDYQAPKAVGTDEKSQTEKEKRHTNHRVLIANRGEISVRIARAAGEAGIASVAVFHPADKHSMHRTMSDSAVELPSHLSPVQAHLSIDALVEAGISSGCTMVHPGYGFLAESADFAEKVESSGLIWVGPPPSVVRALADKTEARKAAIQAGVPVVPGTSGTVKDVKEIFAFADEHGLPLMLKAALGGGGRGIRPVFKREDIEETFVNARSECLAAFGDGSIFVEKMVVRPRHIEVQILADGQGGVVHLHERDCSVQRRNQKVVEQAPAPRLNKDKRAAICNDAVKLCSAVGYRSAGTVEFLYDQESKEHFFMEVNPRIQVEHTVTEEITLVDLVGAQLAIAAGASLAEINLTQDEIKISGFAIQCRVTTEDPARQFAPDTGRLTLYRTPGGPGVRLDGGPGYQGAIIAAHFDSLLVKITCRGISFEACVRKMLRALLETKVRGVKTNIPFLLNVLRDEEFLLGKTHTQWVDNTPRLFDLPYLGAPGQSTLEFLADVAVNGPAIAGSHCPPGPAPKTIPVPPPGTKAPPTCWMKYLEQGPKEFARAIRAHKGLLLTDTTWRDAHQSLFMTRLRTYDMAKVAPYTAHAMSNLFSLEDWGGATFDVSLRFLHECPWDRLRTLRKLVPNIPFQMLLRGANAVGYTAYPDNVVERFVQEAVDSGMNIFRIFDSLNGLENMLVGIRAVKKAGGVAEAAVCYTGDVAAAERGSGSKYTLAYYVEFARQLVEADCDILGIKDMAGLLRPRSATLLVSALRKEFPDIPIHVHTHDTAGTGVASMLACYEAGADIVDAALDTMSGLTSQPSLGAIVGALAGSEDDTGLDLEAIEPLNEYWEQVRRMYVCFDPDVKSGNSDVYLHEMPGGQYTNLLFQSHQLGLEAQWPAIKRAYAQANILLGDIVKVTPSSKVVGDLAQFMVSQDLTPEDLVEQAPRLSFPQSVVDYFRGDLGTPPFGFPEPLRSRVLGSTNQRIEGRPGASLAPLDLVALKKTLIEKHGKEMIRDDRDVLSAALYPVVFDEYCEHRKKFGDVSMLPTPSLLAPLELQTEMSYVGESGQTKLVKLVSIGPLRPDTGDREVFFEMNGMGRIATVHDKKATAGTVVKKRRVADPKDEGQIGAPLSGVVVDVRVKQGKKVSVGTPLVVLSAMKMETVVVAPVPGIIEELCVNVTDSLAANDLILKITVSTD